MLIVRTNDGETFVGNDAKDVVLQMKNSEWSHPDKKREYMIEVADRVQQMTGTAVRAEQGAELFLSDLAASGVVVLEHQFDTQP